MAKKPTKSPTITPAPERPRQEQADYPQRTHIEIPNGVVLAGSDGHYWQHQPPTTAHRAFVRFCKVMKPRGVIYNGDAIDGSSISRFGKIMWQRQQTVAEELEAVSERLGEIEQATARGVPLYYNLGNHCARFESKLSSLVEQFSNVQG